MLNTHPMTKSFRLHFACGIIVLVFSFFMSISGFIILVSFKKANPSKKLSILKLIHRVKNYFYIFFFNYYILY